jgi:ATP-dependent helicase/nuclease subunit A
MTASAPSPIFDVRLHAAADVLAWQNLRDHRPQFSPQQQSMGRLEKLPVDPPANPAATQVIQRFEKTYAHAPFSTRAATVSVTTLAKSAPTPSAHANSATPLQRKLDLPPFFAQDLKAKATDVGTATHTILQYFDFSGEIQTPDIPHQIQNLIQQKRISHRDARLVDTDAIRWLLQSDLGSLLRANHDKLMREVPFAVALAPGDSAPIADPLDQIMVRGRIDLLVPAPPGVAVVDYKTDDVAGPAIAARVESYERQMQLYSQAITQVARRQIAAIYLVFLTPRQIVRIVPQPVVMAPVAP